MKCECRFSVFSQQAVKRCSQMEKKKMFLYRCVAYLLQIDVTVDIHKTSSTEIWIKNITTPKVTYK